MRTPGSANELEYRRRLAVQRIADGYSTQEVADFLGLYRARLAAVAERIGPSIEDVIGPAPDLDPRLVANWDARGGYLRPAEQHDPDAIDSLLTEDLALVASSR